MRVRELPPTGAAGRAGTDPPAIGAGGEHRARPPAQRCHGAQPPARGQRSRAGAGHPAECCGGAGRGHGWAEPVAGPRQSPTACHAGADPKRNSARRTLGGTVRLGVRAWQYRPGADGTRGSRQTDPSRSPTHACPQRRSAPGGARPFRRQEGALRGRRRRGAGGALPHSPAWAAEGSRPGPGALRGSRARFCVASATRRLCRGRPGSAPLPSAAPGPARARAVAPAAPRTACGPHRPARAAALPAADISAVIAPLRALPSPLQWEQLHSIILHHTVDKKRWHLNFNYSLGVREQHGPQPGQPLSTAPSAPSGDPGIVLPPGRDGRSPAPTPSPAGAAGSGRSSAPTTRTRAAWHQGGSKSQSPEQLQLGAAFSIKAEARYLRLLLKPNVRFNKGDKSVPEAVLRGAARCRLCRWMGPASCWHGHTNTHPGDAVTPLPLALPAEGWHRVGTEPSDPNTGLLAPSSLPRCAPPPHPPPMLTSPHLPPHTGRVPSH